MGRLKNMYMEIWEEREPISEVSGKPLLPFNHSKFIWQFAHILSKGAFPNYKFRKENIMLMLPEEHENQESFKSFMDRKEELKAKYFKERDI